MTLLILAVLGQAPDSVRADTIACTCEQALDSAWQHFEHGAYARSITELESLLFRLDGTDDSIDTMAVEAYILLGFNYVAIGDRQTAIDHFKRALIREPKLRIDRYGPTPQITAAFLEARHEQAYESAGCSCLIPGAGQFMRGDDLKGGAVIAGTVVSLASTVVSWSIADSKHDQYIALGPEDIGMMDQVYDDYDRWRKITVLSGTVLIGIYIYSIVDAMIAERPAAAGTWPGETGFYLEYDGEHARAGYAIAP